MEQHSELELKTLGGLRTWEVHRRSPSPTQPPRSVLVPSASPARPPRLSCSCPNTNPAPDQLMIFLLKRSTRDKAFPSWR
eukprot:182828-Rhodomonas_salina.2